MLTKWGLYKDKGLTGPGARKLPGASTALVSGETHLVIHIDLPPGNIIQLAFKTLRFQRLQMGDDSLPSYDRIPCRITRGVIPLRSSYGARSPRRHIRGYVLITDKRPRYFWLEWLRHPRIGPSSTLSFTICAFENTCWIPGPSGDGPFILFQVLGRSGWNPEETEDVTVDPVIWGSSPALPHCCNTVFRSHMSSISLGRPGNQP